MVEGLAARGHAVERWTLTPTPNHNPDPDHTPNPDPDPNHNPNPTPTHNPHPDPNPHQVERWTSHATTQMIAQDLDTSQLHAVSDRRKGGVPAGYD